MNARQLAWDDLQFFLAVARHGTLAGAGDALGVNGSTVQRRIGKLERELGTRLFDRTQRGYLLTGTGEELLSHVLLIEQEVLALGRRVGGRDQALEGRVRVATVDDLAISVLSPLLRQFRRQHPKVAVDLDIGLEFLDLSRQQADVAIRLGAKPTAEDLIVKHVCRVDTALYGSRSYLRRRGRPKSLEALASHDLVRGDEKLARLPMERPLERYGDPSRVALRSNSMLTRLAAIRDGLGLGMLGRFMGEREPGLRRLDFTFPDATSDLWLVVHVDLRRNARVRAFVELIHAALVAQRDLFEAPSS